MPVEVPAEEPTESKVSAMTAQAEALKAALKRAMANQKNSAKPAEKVGNEKSVDERRKMMLLGKKASKTIVADNGTVIVEAGQDITEEVLQKAKLANKFIDLSMNYV